jgi:phosphoglycolate phosphatase-like HAD superfamily hydrolase
MTSTTRPLPSWNDTPTRAAILGFVEEVTRPGGGGYVPPEARVAVFDNDGTLWCEKPLPVQADFLFRRLGEMAREDPSLASRHPWKAVVEGDHAWLGGAITKHYHGDDSDLQLMAGGLLTAYEGHTIESFEQTALEFMRSAINPVLKRPYSAGVYQPMVELLRYLEGNGFACYIATGGGRDFVRTICQESYGIPPERVIGSSVTLEYREVDGVGQIVHTAKLDVLDDGPAKPVRIWSRVGRRPILAGGNANGDVPMLQFAGGPSLPALRLLLLHDDPEREFDYTAGAEAALERARAQDWTVVSLKRDWATVFAP